MGKFTYEPGTYLNVLTEEDVKKIHETALELLESTGTKFMDDEVLEFLEQRGCVVDYKTKVAKMPRELVEQAILDAPESFDLYTPRGDRAFTVGVGKAHFGAGPGGAWTVSPEGVKRDATTDDYRLGLELSSKCSHISVISPTVTVTDWPDDLLDSALHYWEIMEGEKPILGAVWSADSIRECVEMLAASMGDEEKVRQCPTMFVEIDPSPPMKFPKDALEFVRLAIDYGQPVLLVSAPIMGASTPVTFAGGILVHTVETLAMLTYAQLYKPGAKVLYGGICSTLIMRTLYSSSSGPEACLCSAGVANMARYYGIPSLIYMAQNEAKSVDYRAGFETCMDSLISMLSGFDIVYGVGVMDSYIGFCNEKFAMDSELLEYLDMIGNGVEVSDETLLVEDIEDMASGELPSHLSSENNLDLYQDYQCALGEIFDRDSREAWEEKGSVPALEMAKRVIAQTGREATEPRDEVQKRVTEAFEKIIARHGYDANELLKKPSLRRAAG